MNDIRTLAAEPRALTGKGAARAARRAGRIPAVIYGAEQDPIAVSVSTVELLRELQRPGFFRRLYDVEVDGGRHRVLARELQRHVVTDAPLHVDFLRVTAGARIAIAVQVVFDNEEDSPGLKRGGVLNVVRHEVELLCPANAIPDALHVDLTGLDIGDSIHISHIKLPEGVTPTITDRDFTVATIAAPTVTVEAAESDLEEIEELAAETPTAVEE